MSVINLPTPHRSTHRRGPTNCVLCDGPLVAVPMLGSMGCADCGSTFTLDGLAAHRRREGAARRDQSPETEHE